MAAKKSTKSTPKKKPSSQSPVNKSQFIRDNASLPVPEIITKAAKEGFKLSAPFIYTIKSELRKKQGVALAKASSAKPGKPAPKASGSPQAQFAALILKLGTDAARALFDETLRKVEKSIG